MADGDVNVKIKLGADLSGGVQSREELKKIRAEAKRTSSESSEGFKSFNQSVGVVTKSVGLFHKVLAGFGVIGIFTTLISGLEKLAELFGKNTGEARKLRDATRAEGLVKSVGDLADAYAKVKENLADAAAEQKSALDLIDAEVKARRDLQEAKISAAEQDELATVDPNAKDAAEQRAIIQAKYQHMRDTNAASNRVEDLVLQRQKYNTAAEQSATEAAAYGDQATALRAEAQKFRSAASVESGMSTQLNEKDRNSFLSKFSGNLKDIVTFNWGNKFGNEETAEGDAIRKEYAARAKEYEDKAKELEKQAAEQERLAAEKRREEEQNRKLASAMDGSVEAAQINEDTQQMKSSSTEADARRSLEKRREEIRKQEEDERRKKDEEAAKKAREEEEVAKARALLASAPARVESLQRQISANDQGIVSTSFNVATGGTSANAGGEAVAALRQQNAQLNSLLSTLLKEIEQSKRVIERANERARNSKGVDSEEGR